MKWVPVRSSHLCIENEKAGGLPVRQLIMFTAWPPIPEWRYPDPSSSPDRTKYAVAR